MRKLKELLGKWVESPSVDTRNEFLAHLWILYEKQFYIWAKGFLRGVQTSKEKVYESHDINTDFFEKKLLKIKPSTYQEVLELYDSFDKWLWCIHRNWCRTWLKGNKRNMHHERIAIVIGIPDIKQADGDLLFKELYNQVFIILKEKWLQLQIWALRYLGYKIKEIGDMLNLTVDSVKGQLKRARQKLKSSGFFDV